MRADAKKFDSCGVCRRTILSGERVTEYVTPDGTPVGVCALCKAMAEDAGWVPAALAGTRGPGTGPRRRRALGLRRRLSQVSEAARGLGARPGGPGAEHGEAGTGSASPQRAGPSKRAARESRGQRSNAAGRRPGAGGERTAQGRSARGPDARDRILRGGVEAFNASGGPRKVAGLIRSLGQPQVTVRPSPGGRAVVTVAWELSWYQWEVSADENRGAVRELGKGDEMAELDERDRRWNARAAPDGTVTLELAAASRSPQDPE